jgi:late competence protein required for DNA uptake (superfamily II DNA/RNA helicase)
MAYRCSTCNWIDERDKPACTRCGSADITELTTDELFELMDSHEAEYCPTCLSVHLR